MKNKSSKKLARDTWKRRIAQSEQENTKKTKKEKSDDR